jgi:phage-related tail fiber protein
MKFFFRKFYSLCKEIGFARAASALAQQGKYEEAKAMLLARNNCKKC